MKIANLLPDAFTLFDLLLALSVSSLYLGSLLSLTFPGGGRILLTARSFRQLSRPWFSFITIIPIDGTCRYNSLIKFCSMPHIVKVHTCKCLSMIAPVRSSLWCRTTESGTVLGSSPPPSTIVAHTVWSSHFHIINYEIFDC